MPRGLSKIKQVAAEAEARRKAYDESGPGVRYFSPKEGQTVKVRFLEQGEEVWYVWTHQLPRQSGQQYGDAVLCLDQDDKGEPCPGCSRAIPRTARVVINLIWYGAPKFEREMKDGKPGKIIRDSNNNPKIIGTEDVVAVWNASQTVGGRLAYMHERFEKTEAGGLMGVIFDVTRQGTGKATTWMVDPSTEGIVMPTAADRKLYETKGDPRKVIKQLSLGDMERIYSGGSPATTSAPEAGQAPSDMSNNAFAQAAAGAIKRGAFG